MPLVVPPRQAQWHRPGHAFPPPAIVCGTRRKKRPAPSRGERPAVRQLGLLPQGRASAAAARPPFPRRRAGSVQLPPAVRRWPWRRNGWRRLGRLGNRRLRFRRRTFRKLRNRWGPGRWRRSRLPIRDWSGRAAGGDLAGIPRDGPAATPGTIMIAPHPPQRIFRPTSRASTSSTWPEGQIRRRIIYSSA